jgi:hypothetical protein
MNEHSRLDTYYGTETVPQCHIITFKCENNTLKCENDTSFILSSVANDTFKCLN